MIDTLSWTSACSSRSPIARSALFAVAAFLLVGLVSNKAQATILTFNVDMEFSGGTPPMGSAPWVQVKIDDHGATGSVDLQISAINLTGIENVSEVMLNLDPTLNPTALVFSAPTKSRAFDTPAISKGTNSFKADGDGKYDLKLEFASGSGSNTFMDNDSIQYTITGIASLNALSFHYLSSPAGGNGPFTSAVHIQNTNGSGFSGWTTDTTSGGIIVPEPNTFLLLGLGGAVCCLVASRRVGCTRRKARI